MLAHDMMQCAVWNAVVLVPPVPKDVGSQSIPHTNYSVCCESQHLSVRKKNLEMTTEKNSTDQAKGQWTKDAG